MKKGAIINLRSIRFTGKKIPADQLLVKDPNELILITGKKQHKYYHAVTWFDENGFGDLSEITAVKFVNYDEVNLYKKPAGSSRRYNYITVHRVREIDEVTAMQSLL